MRYLRTYEGWFSPKLKMGHVYKHNSGYILLLETDKTHYNAIVLTDDSYLYGFPKKQKNEYVGDIYEFLKENPKCIKSFMNIDEIFMLKNGGKELYNEIINNIKNDDDFITLMDSEELGLI